MRGLDPRTHEFASARPVFAWVDGTSPSMTKDWERLLYRPFVRAFAARAFVAAMHSPATCQ